MPQSTVISVENQLQSAKRVLFLVPKHIGDTIFLTPAFAELRHNKPDLVVDALASSVAAAETLANNPLFTNIAMMSIQSLVKMSENYDAIVSFLECPLATYADVKQCLLYHMPAPKQILNQHWRQYTCEYLAKLFGYPTCSSIPYQLYPQDKHVERINRLLGKFAITPNMPLVGIHAGNSGIVRKSNDQLKRLRAYLGLKPISGKSWPLKNFVSMVERLHRHQRNLHFILTGTANENFIARAFKHLPYVISLIGETSVLELAALMQRLQMMISNDTGPLHVACAMDIPLISFFKLRSACLHAPVPKSGYSVMFKTDNMKKIKVKQVEQAFLELYAKKYSNG